MYIKLVFSIISLLVLWLVVGSHQSLAQEVKDDYVTVAGDANACELNASLLDNLANMARESNERVFVIARLGRGETSRYLIHRRLFNAHTYLDGRVKSERLIIAEGSRTKEQGRVEFFLGSKLMIKALVSRGGDLCVNCCEGLEHYYGWGKKDSKRKIKQLESLTP